MAAYEITDVALTIDETPADRLRAAAQALRTGTVDVCSGDLTEPLAVLLDEFGGIVNRYGIHPASAKALAVAGVILGGDRG